MRRRSIPSSRGPSKGSNISRWWAHLLWELRRHPHGWSCTLGNLGRIAHGTWWWNLLWWRHLHSITTKRWGIASNTWRRSWMWCPTSKGCGAAWWEATERHCTTSSTWHRPWWSCPQARRSRATAALCKARVLRCTTPAYTWRWILRRCPRKARRGRRRSFGWSWRGGAGAQALGR